MGDDQGPTEGDSRLRREPLQQATDVRAPRSWTQRADGLAASAAAVALLWCGHTDGRLWPGGRQRSASIAGVEVVRRWCRTAVSCNSPGDTRWTPERASWWHSRTTIGLLVVTGCNRSDRRPWHGPPATAHGCNEVEPPLGVWMGGGKAPKRWSISVFFEMVKAFPWMSTKYEN